MVQCLAEAGDCSLPKVSRPALGPTQLPLEQVPGGFAPVLKQLGNQVGHSSPPTPKIKNEWSCTSFPLVPLWYAQTSLPLHKVLVK